MNNPKPKVWEMSIKSDKKVEAPDTPDSGFIFPCSGKRCLVSASCDLYCYHVFNYMNFIADNIYTMTADQIKLYRESTPLALKRKIQDFYMSGRRLANPESATVSRDWK